MAKLAPIIEAAMSLGSLKSHSITYRLSLFSLKYIMSSLIPILPINRQATNDII